jgi:hypothetical protein
MRSMLIPVLLFITFISCEKNESGNLKYVETTSGGCFLNKALSSKNSQIMQMDTVIYSFTNDSLNIFVGFNATCCGKFGNSSSIKGDSIIIKVITTQIGLCNCLCYYTYKFRFSGNADSYKYHVSIDDHLNFIGQIKP